MSAKRILVQIKGRGDDGCTFYRGAGPWSTLSKDHKDNVSVLFFHSTDVHWADLKMADVIFFMRPHEENELQLIRKAKSLGVSVWIDIDDDLFKLTPDNPAKFLYEPYDVQQRMKAIISLSDVVTVSTKELELKMLYEMDRSVHQVQLIPNAYDPMFDSIYSGPTNESLTPKIIYRGSPTHQRDLELMSDSIFTIDQQNKVSWFFMGLEPWNVEELKNSVYFAPRAIMDYFQDLSKISAHIGIVPLADTLFNRSKSNIAAMELSLTGAAIVCPNWPEWKNIPGVFLYEDQESFRSAVNTAINLRGTDLQFRANQTHHYFKNELSLRAMNLCRLDLVENLCS